MLDSNSIPSATLDASRLEQAERRDSSIISRELRDGAVVYSKQYLPGEGGRTSQVVYERVRRETSLLAELLKCPMFCGRLGVMRIIAADPAKAHMVTQEVAGYPMDELVRSRFRRTHRESIMAMFLAGSWLKFFQSARLGGVCDDFSCERDPINGVDFCRMRLERLGRQKKPWRGTDAHDQLLSTVERLERLAEPGDSRQVWSHGDYSPGNIIWDGRVLTPIDFAMCRTRFPLHDVTCFIHRLEMNRIYRPWKRLPITVWQRAFLRGYGRPDAAHSPMYRALMIRHWLCRLQTYVLRPTENMKQALHAKWIRASVRKRLAREVCNRDGVDAPAF